MTKDEILCTGLWTYGSKMRVYMTYSFLGVLSVSMTADAKSTPTIVPDLVPGHNQTKSWIKSRVVPKLRKGRNLQNPSSENISGTDCHYYWWRCWKKGTCLMSSKKKAWLLSTSPTSWLDKAFCSLKIYDRILAGMIILHCLWAMLRGDTHVLLASTISWPLSVHRSGNFAVQFNYEWIPAFLVLAKTPRYHIFLHYMTI